MSKECPKTLYGYWENEGEGFEDSFFVTNPDPEFIVEIGETKRVAVYEFKGYADIRNATSITVVEV